MKRLGFGGKVLLILSSIIVFCLATMIWINTYYSYSSATKNSKEYVKELSKHHALKVKNGIDQSLIISKQISKYIEEALRFNKDISKGEILDFLKSSLKNTPLVQGTWLAVDNNKLFSSNLDINSDEIKAAINPNKEFAPYVIKSPTGNVSVKFNSGFILTKPYISKVKETKKEYITKPYKFRDTYISVLSYPLFYKGEFLGAVGTIFNINMLNKKLENLKIFDTGFAIITDSDCNTVVHKKKSLIGKNVLDNPKIGKDSAIQGFCKSVKNGEDYSFTKQNIATGDSAYFYSHILPIGNTGKNWSFMITISEDEYLKDAKFARNLLIIGGIIIVLIIILVLYFTTRLLNKNLNSISTGLSDFFLFLNKQSENTTEIQINSDDEFGKMAHLINDNVSNVKANINEENSLIKNVTSVVNNINKGLFDKKIEANANSEALNTLKELMNEMLDTLEGFVGKDINKIQDALLEYSKSNFTKGLDGSTGTIGDEINILNKIINEMLQLNQSGGLTLENSSKDLTNNIQTITNNATSQAASLEETAASIEEITGNISNTNQKAQEMLNISSSTKKSANEGKNLASKTVTSMDEINEQVTLINEAITVIDQIAFQTNILSLNAAVEAATAGEAGKGFAVVAQEVRNLAARSAEAAKEIKDLVENATSKANEGKEISSSMIEGFNVLEEKIGETNLLIEDVSAAAREQSTAMAQISDAINQLDKFTQENASIADKTNNIAKETYSIATNLVKEANKSEFKGKK